MIVKPRDEGLFIEPETEFETTYLGRFQNHTFQGYVKCGLSPAEILGLIIKPKKEDPKNEKSENHSILDNL